VARLRITYPGYEHLTFDVVIERLEPKRVLAWRWHPNPVEPSQDYSNEPTTLVTFELEDAADGTRLTLTEWGFDALPAERRAEAFRGNDEGWTRRWTTSSSTLKAPPRADSADSSNLSNTASVFDALGDETRLRLVARLGADGPLSIACLTRGTAVTRQAVTKHLVVLADAGLARGMRQGREQLWQLQPESLSSAKRYLDEVSQSWDQALNRLKRFVEEPPG